MFPMMGTGNTFYAQFGYLFKKDLLGNAGTLQPYVATQYSVFELFKDSMLMYEVGMNWLIDGHKSKLSLHYQNRPVYIQNGAGEYISGSRKGMAVMQFQISI